MMNFKPGRRPNRVTAVFQNAAFTFNVARETTLAQLAEQLSALSEVHGGLPLSVDVRVAAEHSR
jgi:hypothetical protein